MPFSDSPTRVLVTAYQTIKTKNTTNPLSISVLLLLDQLYNLFVQLNPTRAGK